MLFCPLLIVAMDPPSNYLKVKPNKGEGAYGLLRSYQLLDKTENLQRFYELNKLDPGSPLKKGQTYILPIKFVNYDGKSIRTSMKIDDYYQAKELQIYNDAMVEAGLKSKSFIKDKVLWIPESYSPNNGIVQRVNTIQAVKSQSKSQEVNKSPVGSALRELVADRRIDLEDAFTVTKSLESDEDMSSPNTSYVKKVSGKMLNVSLFGKKECQVPVESDELENQVFYIIPGHGGPDPGAVYVDKETNFSFCEDEYAYDVSLRLARNLLTRGAYVYLIVQDKNDGIRDERYLECDTDEECIGGHEMPVNQLKRLRQGMIKTNQLYLQHKLEGVEKQWMISIHIDSQPEENRQDVFFYYQSESKASKKKAKILQSLFTEKYSKFQGRNYNGSISTRPLYVMRTSEADPIYIELANIRNAEDRERIASPRNRQLLADWLMEAFL